MKFLIVTWSTLVLATALCARSAMGPAPPRTRLARDLVVVWDGSQWPRRIRRPGTYDLEFPCTSVQGMAARLTVEVTAQQPGGEGPAAYRECTAQEARRQALAGSEAMVRFTDSVTDLSGPAQGRLVALPDGRSLAVARIFSTRAGLYCLVPAEETEAAELVRAVLPGDELVIRGRLLLTQAGDPCVLVDGLEFPGEPARSDEPPWSVVVRWAGREEARFSEAGDYAVRLPCLHRDGAMEHVRLRLREFEVVDLVVDGHPVAAELADTPAKRSWGLQGRSGLEADEGMLFYFPQRLRATFVMKAVSFPLSIAFIRADGAIGNIEKLNPGDTHAVASRAPVNYVLEMEQGWFRERDVVAGESVRIP